MRRFPLYLLMVLLLMIASLPAAGRSEDYKTTPTLNEGKKWRIAYYESGPYADYHQTLKVVVQGLMDLGWIEPKPVPEFPDLDDNRPLWRWLNHSARSDYLRFLEDGYWSADWEDDRQIANREMCIDRLKRGDVDLIIAMGTRAGQDLANDRHAVPTFVMSSTDPVASGIVRSVEDSGYDHVIAKCEPYRYIRQIHLCYDIFRFNVIGVVNDDLDPDGRVFSHLDHLKRVGAARGFRVVACNAPDRDNSLETVALAYRKCVRSLAPKIDLFYLSHHRGANPEFLYETLKPLYARGVPAWSSRGSILVKAGAVMSISREDFSFLAPFYAEAIAKIFNGVKPRELDQRVKETLQLAVNLEAARLTGYTVPPNVLKIADTVYHRIEKPSDGPEN